MWTLQVKKQLICHKVLDFIGVITVQGPLNEPFKKLASLSALARFVLFMLHALREGGGMKHQNDLADLCFTLLGVNFYPDFFSPYSLHSLHYK